MKNSILIDLDTDRERPILFSKAPDTILPDNKEDAYKMIVNDIATLSYAIKTLIIMTNDTTAKDLLVKSVVKTVNEAITEQTDEFKEKTERSSTEETKESV